MHGRILSFFGQNEDPVDNFPLSSLPEDILAYLALFLDFKSIYQMRLFSKDYQIKIDGLLEKKDFWIAKAKLELEEKQLEGIVDIADYKTLLLKRFTLLHTLNNEMETKKYFVPCTITNFFKNKKCYKNGITNIEFDLEEITPLILKDNAKGLFKKTTRLSHCFPVIQEDNFDVKGLEKILLAEEDNNQFVIADLCFIKFLPAIIKSRAINCFDLFIRAYLGLCSLGFGHCMIKPYTMEKVLKTLSECDDKIFTDRFIYLTIKLFNVDDAGMYQVIQFVHTHQLYDILKKSVNEVSEERKSIILNACTKYDFYEQMLMNMETGYERKMHLDLALKDAIRIINDIPNLTPYKVIALQERLNTSMNDLIESLKTKDSSFAYSSYIRPS